MPDPERWDQQGRGFPLPAAAEDGDVSLTVTGQIDLLPAQQSEGKAIGRLICRQPAALQCLLYPQLLLPVAAATVTQQQPHHKRRHQHQRRIAASRQSRASMFSKKIHANLLFPAYCISPARAAADFAAAAPVCCHRAGPAWLWPSAQWRRRQTAHG